MGRVVIYQGSLNIAYGSDHATGYFLSVSDTRLQYRPGAPAEVNKIAGLVEEKQGYGGLGYFELHTAMIGLGFGASIETLIYYWGMYGVPKNHIERARRGLDVPGSATYVTVQDYIKSRAPQNPPRPTQPSDKIQNFCLVCGQPTTQRCTKCGAFWACGPEHAKQAWSKHKPQCQRKAEVKPKHTAALAPIPTKPLESDYPIAHIKGYFLEEDATSPQLVDVEVERRPSEGGILINYGWDDAARGICKLFQVAKLGIIGGIEASGDPESRLLLFYATDFAARRTPYTQWNKCVEELTKGETEHEWVGPLMLMKYPRHSVDRFGDVDSKDLESAIKFFKT